MATQAAADSESGRIQRVERRANAWARGVAAVVFILGVAVVLVPAALHAGDVFRADPFKPRQTHVTVTQRTPRGVSIVETERDADQSFVERSFAEGGLLLLRVGIVALAAFLAGAVVQRTLLSDFALKVGPVEVPELRRAAAVSDRALGDLTAALDSQAERTARTLEVAASLTERVEALEEKTPSAEGSDEDPGR
jgi:hypothetical protein